MSMSGDIGGREARRSKNHFQKTYQPENVPIVLDKYSPSNINRNKLVFLVESIHHSPFIEINFFENIKSILETGILNPNTFFKIRRLVGLLLLNTERKQSTMSIKQMFRKLKKKKFLRKVCRNVCDLWPVHYSLIHLSGFAWNFLCSSTSFVQINYQMDLMNFQLS